MKAVSQQKFRKMLLGGGEAVAIDLNPFSFDIPHQPGAVGLEHLIPVICASALAEPLPPYSSNTKISNRCPRAAALYECGSRQYSESTPLLVAEWSERLQGR